MTIFGGGVASNEAAFGAGVYNGGDPAHSNYLSLNTSTVSSNTGREDVAAGVASSGGGLFNAVNAHAAVTNSTIAFNSAASAGGIGAADPPGTGFVTLRNTILSNNRAAPASSD